MYKSHFKFCQNARPSHLVLSASSLLALSVALAGCGGGGGGGISPNPTSAPTPRSTPGIMAPRFKQVNLVADTAGAAPHQDANLLNPQGLISGASGVLQVAANGAGVASAYTATGGLSAPTIRIPSAVGQTRRGKPTGIAINHSFNFLVPNGSKSAPGTYIFAGQDGTISVWNTEIDPTTATLAVDRSALGAVYRGLAIVNNGTRSTLYAANFHSGAIDTFGPDFSYLRSFSDPNIPTGYAPFNIQNLNDQLYVTYARQNAPKTDAQTGAGSGFVDVFSTQGTVIHRLVAHGQLNAPWGLALAPTGFGSFGNDLIVGNFGDGHINAYDPNTGALRGTLSDSAGKPFAIPGLWGLDFATGTSSPSLFFVAGGTNQQHGLLGRINYTTAM